MRLRTKVTLFFGLIALIATRVADRRHLRLRPLLAARAAHRGGPPAGRAQRPPGPGRSCARGTEGFGDFFTTIRTEHGRVRRRPRSATTGRRAPTTQFSVRELPRRPAPGRRRRGRPACSASTLGDDHYVGVGIHIADVDADYYEAFQLGSTESTLRTILLALVIGTAITVLLATGVGLVDEPPPAAPARADHRRRRRDRRRRPRHPRRPGGRSRPRPARRLVQRHGRRRAGPHRARGPLRLRRQPRAALPDHRPGRRRRGHRRPARRAPRPHPAGARRRRRPGPPLRRHGHRPARAVPHRRRGDRPAHRGGRHRRAVRAGSPPATASPTCRSTCPATRRQRRTADGDRRQAALRADPRQPAGERRPPRRRAAAHLDRADRRTVPPRRRRGRRAGRRPRRAGPHLRALRPGQRRPPPHRHRARPGPRRRARHGPGRRGVGRGPPGRRRPLRRAHPDGAAR